MDTDFYKNKQNGKKTALKRFKVVMSRGMSQGTSITVPLKKKIYICQINVFHFSNNN